MTASQNSAPAVSRIHIAGLIDSSGWSTLQKVIVLLTAATIVFDGMDIQMMGFAIPAIAKEWGVVRSAFAPILACGLFGVAVGTAIGGILGDRIGRSKALVGSVIVFGVATLGFALAHSIPALFVLRLIAGLGIGGALPNATTLTAEFTPANKRPVAVTIAIVCIPLGGVLAGLISAHVLASGNWRTLFYIGGVSPLLLALLLSVALPESPRYLARHARRWPELIILLNRLGLSVGAGSEFFDDAPPTGADANAFTEIFGGEKRRDTFAVWFAFFCCLVSVYLVFNWLPSVLTGLGLGIKTASQGLATYNFGGIFGALAFAWWISKKGSRVPLLTGAVFGIVTAVMVRLVPVSGTGDHTLLLVALTLHGLFVNAVQTTMYALAAHIYTTRARATGVAGALAIGRTGAIASAFLGSYLLKFGSGPYFLALAMGMLGVTAGLFVLRAHIGKPPISVRF